MVELPVPTEGLQTVEDSHQRHQRGGNKHEGRSSGRVRNKEWQETPLCPDPTPCPMCRLTEETECNLRQ